MIHKRLYVATESWLVHTHTHTCLPTNIVSCMFFILLNTCRWGLSSLELCVISMLLSSLPPSSCRDIPIFLPKASNKVAHRLVVLTLLEGTYAGAVFSLRHDGIVWPVVTSTFLASFPSHIKRNQKFFFFFFFYLYNILALNHHGQCVT